MVIVVQSQKFDAVEEFERIFLEFPFAPERMSLRKDFRGKAKGKITASSVLTNVVVFDTVAVCREGIGVLL